MTRSSEKKCICFNQPLDILVILEREYNLPVILIYLDLAHFGSFFICVSVFSDAI